MLLAEEDAIEAAVGEDLVWDPLDGKQACWIGLSMPRPSFTDPVETEPAARWAADAVLRVLLALEDRVRAGATELITALAHR